MPFFKPLAFAAVLVALLSLRFPPLWWLLLPLMFLGLVGVYDLRQTRHTLWRNFPVIGRMRWVLEALRPPIRQYFIESDIDGVPFSRMARGLVYRRAKKQISTIPFGTKVDVYAPGYEWIGHSLDPLPLEALDPAPRVRIGGPACQKPYEASILNVSAMSFGALSRNAILALGQGAARGGFALNTGEGGITRHHLTSGADLIWQIGTAYFGCRNADGSFNAEAFAHKARHDAVRMIEIKLSQGAKPGHGGILPAAKNTPEIALERGVEPHTTVISPPKHTAFETPEALMHFIDRLRTLCGGKPVGFKLCIGQKGEFTALCRAMIHTGLKPDFITVDGGEGGTGAAPLEYTNAIGMPLRDALVFVADTLRGFDLQRDVKVIASGRILDGMDIARALALGADLCAGARGMMFALGCIQALQCHKNRCPTGIATQDPRLSRGLAVDDKTVRVANYHVETVKSFVEILASAGLKHPDDLDRTHIFYRLDRTHYKRYDELFVPLKAGSYLTQEGAEH